MHVAWCNNPATLCMLAADRVGAVLARKPQAAIALPTGRTPMGLYALLCTRVAAGALSFARARLFNLDEFVGLAPDHPHSYGGLLHRQLLDRIDVSADRLRLLHGDAVDLDAECRSYDAALADADGLDLAILGLGANGHVAFNEPGTDPGGATHVVALSEATRAAQQQQTAAATPLPAHGLTMGIATLAAAREVLLLVAGDNKQQALAALLCGPVSPQWPVTYLRDHANLTVISALRPSHPY